MFASLSSAGSSLGKEFYEAASSAWSKSRQDVERICSAAEGLFQSPLFQLIAAASSSYFFLVRSGLTTSEALNNKILNLAPQLLGGFILSQPVLRESAHYLATNSLYDATLIGLNLRSHLLPSRYPWWSKVDDKLLVGSLPLQSMDHLKQLQTENPQLAVFSVLEPWELGSLGPFSSAERIASHPDISWKHLSVPDLNAPSLESLKEGVKWIEEQTQNGKTVYIHCKAGVGRSATMAAAYLIYRYRLNPEQAMEKVSKARPAVFYMPKQTEALYNFWKGHSTSREA